MNKVIQFIADLDYSINRVAQGRSAKTPKMIRVLQSFYHREFSSDWYNMPPSFTLNQHIINNYIEVEAIFREETSTDIERERSATTPENIAGLIRRGAFFSNEDIEDPTPYNRDTIAEWGEYGHEYGHEYGDEYDGNSHDYGDHVAPPRRKTVCDQMGHCVYKAATAARGLIGLGGRKTKKQKRKDRKTRSRR
jgi:hypothetical protein